MTPLRARAPELAEWADDIREAFGDGRAVAFGALVRYARLDGKDYGTKGPEGVPVVMPGAKHERK